MSSTQPSEHFSVQYFTRSSILKFVAFDLETTGFGDESAICEFSFAKFEDDLVIQTFSSLVKPGPNAKWVKTASDKTGIYKSDVRDAPSLSSQFRKVQDFIGDLPLVAHNASFDVNAWVSEGGFEMQSFCTKVLSKTIASKDGDLKGIAEAFGITFNRLHRAEDDAIVCGKLFFSLTKMAKVDSLQSLAGVYPGSIIRPTLNSRTNKKSSASTEHSMGKSDFEELRLDPKYGSIRNEALSGKTVIFSETQIVKATAGQLVMALVGGVSKNHVDTKTDYLVVPNLEKVTSAPTTKMKKALELAQKGKKVQIISELDFLELLASSGSLEEILSKWS